MSTPTFEVILTHEHADFDALASLLAAALFFPGATPVLPYHLNRNVYAFLMLYKNHFPFVKPKDLRHGRITRAILVDTRTVNLPRGTHEDTQFFIIDHHMPASASPLATPGKLRGDEWSEPVGANTTLLVEKLSEQNRALSPVQATLLALGIHEDTGSLTYSTTTYRDVRSLAWLMEPERGINLDLLNQFLRHPLSEEQRKLLDHLIDHSEFVEVSGHMVVIAQAEAPGFSSELSSLVHRLRDIYECDAVFLVVQLKEIVQVVARSITDDIDVGEVTRVLGGGGHIRAAAAPVREPDTRTVRDRIVALLQKNSRPAITVRQIMSMGRPQTLSPDLSIQEAGVLMRRYGHEGFPVVEKQADGQEKLLGVLTRRETDRALNHNLGNAPVHRFMQAGQVTVRAIDSIATLHRSMIESHWGQIPVVDEQDRMIGIVTRTDLIKLWGESQRAHQPQNTIDQQLKSSLAPTQYALLQLVGKAVDQLNFTVYVVGGFVRDLLLNDANAHVRAMDMDIVIEGNAIDFALQLQSKYGGRVVAHKQFGTAKWLLDDPAQPVQIAKLLANLANLTPDEVSRQATDWGEGLPAHLDFVTARTEFYTAPTVLPTTEQSSIKLDLHRRDFTINTLAIALNPDRWGQLLDFYGGQHDLQEGIVRVLHSLSFVDDPTRILRAVRYEQRFNFRIGARTLELLQDAQELLERVTPARIRHELERLLQEKRPEKALQRLAGLGVLASLHPDLKMHDWTATQFAQLRTARNAPDADPLLMQEPIEDLYWGLLMLPLPAEAHAALTARLSLKGETQRLVDGLRLLQENRELLREPHLRPSRAVQILDKAPLVAVALLRVTTLDVQIADVLQRYVSEWRAVHAELNGDDLQALGLPRGPLYSKILTQLRTARLDGLIATRAEEMALVQKMLVD